MLTPMSCEVNCIFSMFSLYSFICPVDLYSLYLVCTCLLFLSDLYAVIDAMRNANYLPTYSRHALVSVLYQLHPTTSSNQFLPFELPNKCRKAANMNEFIGATTFLGVTHAQRVATQSAKANLSPAMSILVFIRSSAYFERCQENSIQLVCRCRRLKKLQN